MPPLLALKGLRTRHVGPADLAIDPGECVCLSGPSGAGKTLLLRAIADLDPHEGTAELDGRNAEQFIPSEWRRQVALLPAESPWWRDRVGAHFPDSPPAAWLEALGFPCEVMEWEVGRCSTGERQRLALMRLLARGPRVLLLDEPTASLDPASARAAERLIGEYRRERSAAVLWVSHDPSQIARVSDRRLELAAGRLTAA